MKKQKINILIPIFVLLVLIYAIRSILGPSIKTESLQRDMLENVINTKGLMIKYESVIDPGSAGFVEPLVQEGARVALGQSIAAIYSDKVDTGVKNKLEQVNRKIVQIEKNQSDLSSFGNDETRLEQKIVEQTGKLVEQGLSGNMIGAGETEILIMSLCEKKAQILGNTSGSLLDSLQNEKANLEAQIGTASTYLAAPSSGVFSSAVDGLESTITPYNMTELNPESLKDLLEKGRKEAEEDSASCKIVQNFRYFVAVNLPAKELETAKVGDTVRLRFYDLSGDLIPVTIFHISEETEGEKTVIVEGNRHLDTLFKRRTVNLDFVLRRFEGYRVSVKSLKTKDDVTGVYVRREDMLTFIPVTILYNTEDTCIVNSADGQNPLRLYDEVVVSADSYEEGKKLR